MTSDEFQKYFKDKYLTDYFYNGISQEFHDFRLGQLYMDDFITKFTSLLRYVLYLMDENVKLHQFLSSLTAHMKERIKFVNPRTMDEVIRKACDIINPR